MSSRNLWVVARDRRDPSQPEYTATVAVAAIVHCQITIVFVGTSLSALSGSILTLDISGLFHHTVFLALADSGPGCSSDYSLTASLRA